LLSFFHFHNIGPKKCIILPAVERVGLHVVVLSAPRGVGADAVGDDAETPGVGHVDVGVVALVVPGVDHQVAEKTALAHIGLGQHVARHELISVEVESQQLGGTLLDTALGNVDLAGVQDPQTTASVVNLRQ
jgi:hypothetical protein